MIKMFCELKLYKILLNTFYYLNILNNRARIIRLPKISTNLRLAPFMFIIKITFSMRLVRNIPLDDRGGYIRGWTAGWEKSMNWS